MTTKLKPDCYALSSRSEFFRTAPPDDEGRIPVSLFAKPNPNEDVGISILRTSELEEIMAALGDYASMLERYGYTKNDNPIRALITRVEAGRVEKKEEE